MGAKVIRMLFFVSIAFPVFAQNQSVKTAFLEKWRNSEGYLLEMAALVPEESYAFKPTDQQMSFGEQLIHITQNMQWLSTTYFLNQEYKRSINKADSMTKSEILILLKSSFEATYKAVEQSEEQELTQKVSFFAGEKTKIQILNLLQDHVTHHRGQLVVYLNLLQIKPPRYVGW